MGVYAFKILGVLVSLFLKGRIIASSVHPSKKKEEAKKKTYLSFRLNGILE